MEVVEAPCISTLEPRDHLHFNHERIADSDEDSQQVLDCPAAAGMIPGITLRCMTTEFGDFQDG
jgi:hypothetical protein